MNKFKKCLLAIVLCLSILFLSSFTTEASAQEVSPKEVTDTSSEENWGYILNNVDIDIKYLEPNKYLWQRNS